MTTFDETVVRGVQGQPTDDLRPGDRIEIVAALDAPDGLGNVETVSGPLKIGDRTIATPSRVVTGMDGDGAVQMRAVATVQMPGQHPITWAGNQIGTITVRSAGSVPSSSPDPSPGGSGNGSDQSGNDESAVPAFPSLPDGFSFDDAQSDQSSDGGLPIGLLAVAGVGAVVLIMEVSN